MGSGLQLAAQENELATSSAKYLIVAAPPVRLHASPYFATSLRVIFSPPPLVRIGRCGFCTGFGIQKALLTL